MAKQGKRRAKSEIIEILRRLKASDLTIAAFARQEGLSISTLLYLPACGFKSTRRGVSTSIEPNSRNPKSRPYES